MLVASIHENSHKFHLFTNRVIGEGTNVERVIDKEIIIKGRHHNKDFYLYKDPAFTEVDPKDWEAIQKLYSNHFLLKDGLIFAADTDNKTKDKAAKVIDDIDDMPDPARPIKADKNGKIKNIKITATK